MKPTQQPTCTGLRIRSALDANVLFHAVAMNILPMVVHRLDAADRAALCPGCVYVWEERCPDADATKVGMERFTEGRHWHQSRVRDDFLVYYEKEAVDMQSTAAAAENWAYVRQGHSPQSPHPLSGSSPYCSPEMSSRARNAGRLIKQTYSAWVKGPRGLRKWHMNAYYSEESLESLLTVDHIPTLARLPVPHECYQRARTTKCRDPDQSRNNPRLVIGDETSHSYHANPRDRTYAPYPSPPNEHEHLHQNRYTPQNTTPSFPPPSSQPNTNGLSPDRTHSTPPFRLVPLERLLNSTLPRRERLDDEVLRSFRLQ